MSKKILRTLAFVLAAGMVLALAGCSGGEEERAVDIQGLAPKLISDLAWKEELMEITSDSVLTNYYQVAMEDLSFYALYRSSSGATAEEIAVFEAKDDAAAGRVEEAVTTRVDDLKFAFEDYVPAELPKIENAVIYRSGCYVVLVTNDDDAAALEIVKDLIG